MRLAIQNLAGVPAIVYGLFGLGFFIEFVGRGIDRFFFQGTLVWGQPAILWAALTMALLTLPTRGRGDRRGAEGDSNGLPGGGVLPGSHASSDDPKDCSPSAVGGILTGGILAISRGAGEVAPILFTGAAYYLPYLPKKLNDQFMEMGYHILRDGHPVARCGSDETYSLRHSVCSPGHLFTFALNFTAVWIRSKIRRKLEVRPMTVPLLRVDQLSIQFQGHPILKP